MAEKGKKAETVVATNRKAFHDYNIEERYEAGMALQGTEVKAIREGLVNLRDSFARVDGTEVILHNCHIDPYTKAAAQYNHDPLRERRLLAHRREIRKLEAETKERGTTLIPLAIYFKGSHAKVEIGVAKGKQHHDKRQSIKKKEMDRDVRRAMSHRQ